MNKSSNTLLWIGAGSASYPILPLDKFERLIFVEARPKVQPIIPKSVNSKIEIYNVCLVAHNTSGNSFNVYNVEDVSSVDTPTALYDIYPSLKKNTEVSVKFELITDFLKNIEIDDEDFIELVIDIPDISKDFLIDIIQSPLFDQVKKITLLAARSKLFRHSAEMEDLIILLDKHVGMHFDLDESDPDFPICHIKIAQSAFEKKMLSELQVKLQEMTLARDRQKKHHEDNRTWAESLKQQLEASEKQLLNETSLRVKAEQVLVDHNLLIQEQKVETERVLNAIEEKLLDMTLQCDQHKLNHEDSKAQVESLKGILEASEKKLLAELSLRVENDNELAQKELQINVLKSKLDKSDEELISKTGELKEADRRIEQMLTMQTMNMRLLQKSESDNVNLRERIANNNDEIESMTALLTELHEKLKLASNFYEQLTVQHPELLEKPSYE
tara:strand:- start:338 stop:1669 length:1332 start_codon:yes stop_codon:yes gene_type:complete